MITEEIINQHLDGELFEYEGETYRVIGNKRGSLRPIYCVSQDGTKIIYLFSNTDHIILY